MGLEPFKRRSRRIPALPSRVLVHGRWASHHHHPGHSTYWTYKPTIGLAHSAQSFVIGNTQCLSQWFPQFILDLEIIHSAAPPSDPPASPAALGSNTPATPRAPAPRRLP